ncbi:cytoplasmic protein [Leptotrichia sp. OH3620_COT-345]|uniref:glutamine amidotransferase n=1 Tax=Leptotrichia sp. OH3620_COT-345 TaxID=2491048 RepID=UPI000F647DB8|nr:glutamine amidotransferase [Leptotrichia sp. OH3620_COT-345]RRD40885.1 cytoplasmic protein [Leptotrichia sp. OH3620_COT-345]
MSKILIAGESWTSHTIHIKGFDTFTTSVYEEGVRWLKEALEKDSHEVTFIPNHYASEKFPVTMEEISQYDVVILSDIGSNTLLLPVATFARSEKTPNRCELIKEYVQNGGGFCMIGGYMSFTGIDAKTRYGETAVKDILPVNLLKYDDRVEKPEGIVPKISKNHQIFEGIDEEFPFFLGYNKTIEDDTKGEVIASINEDPFIAVGTFGKGRSVAFTSDCAPHWGSKEFVEWKYYNKLWQNIIKWVSSND